MGITSILDTAKQALLAQQAALQVVGQNIANVNTPGYSRQRPVILPEPPGYNGKVFRTGVDVDHVERVFDRFIGVQVNLASANFQSAQTKSDLLSQVESLFNGLSLEDVGLASSLENLFQGFQELSNNAAAGPERNVLQQRGTVVANAFNELNLSIESLGRDLNTMLRADLREISSLSSQIADLNVQILRVEVNPKNPANALRDQQDVLLKKLSEKVGITSFEDSNGRLTVLLGNSRPLIEGTRANSLIPVADPNNPRNLLVQMQDVQGNTIDISSSITSGRIQGLLEVRDSLLPSFTNSVNRLAAQLTSSVNQAHSNGYGLDGSTGNNFFVPRQVSGQALAENTGGGILTSLTVFDPTQLTLDDYSITFNSPATTFDIVNTTTGATMLTGQTYTSGASIRFEGIEVNITDGASAPQAGDIFQISSTKDAAANIAVDPAILKDPKKIAAGGTPLPGDNANALALAQLRDAKTIDGNTFGEFYTLLVTTVGLETLNSSIIAEQRELVVTEAENRRESLSGVSLEEEQLDLIRFQQAFVAAANYIRVADEMAETVLNMAR
jgi:flagellar hook-associated protein 1 FlgK